MLYYLGQLRFTVHYRMNQLETVHKWVDQSIIQASLTREHYIFSFLKIFKLFDSVQWFDWIDVDIKEWFDW